MSNRRGKPQTIQTTGLVARNKAERVKFRQPKVVKEKEERLIAPKRSYRPHFLKPSSIRRMCHLPAEKCDSKTEAKVMYFNSKFGKCSLSVCHEDLCPLTEVCKKHKEKQKPKRSIAMAQRLSRIIKKSARISAIPRRKLNNANSRKATKSSRD